MDLSEQNPHYYLIHSSFEELDDNITTYTRMVPNIDFYIELAMNNNNIRVELKYVIVIVSEHILIIVQ